VKPWQKWLVRAGWLIVILPALYQIAVLIYTIGHRVGYPYDLEWMEGGMLHHAQRIANGDGIYGPPTIDFIPYLYTPLYPGVIAFLGGIFGIGYALGRTISVLSLLGTAGVAAASIAGPAHRTARTGADDRTPAWIGVATALGLWAAAYPFSGGWYDLVRNDAFFLLLATAGIHCAARWARAGTGWGGHGRIAAVAAILALSFFAKQTGIMYVAAGGVVILILSWRRLPTYVAVAGTIGLGGSWLLQHRSDGWFWHYIREVHQKHDFNMDRFWGSFGHILGHFPLMTATVAIGVVVVAATAIKTRQLPAAARPLVLWAPVFALSTLVGAIGWGTEFAVWNAYMPAMLHGAIAAGCAVPAVAACARLLVPASARRRLIVGGLAAAIAILPGIDLFRARWSPTPYLPTTADRTANDELIKRIAAIDGDVWVTFDPWYAHLAGKTMFTHRMGIKDVTDRQPGSKVLGMTAALRDHRFAAIFFDQHGVVPELALVKAGYRRDDKLPPDARPRLYIGPHPGSMGMPGQVRPDTVWVPATAAPPPIGARILFDFESGHWDQWKHAAKDAWGAAPVTQELPGQGPVYRFGGRYFADSMHGGDQATGTLESPSFPIDGARITFRLAGGTDAHALRVELIVDDQVVVASTPSQAGDALDVIAWDVSQLRGKTGRIRIVDAARAAGGHLDVDDFLIWNDQTGTPAPASDTPRR